MKIIVHSCYPILNRNQNLLRGIVDVSVVDLLKQMVRLKEIGWTRGIDLFTSDVGLDPEPDAILFLDMPRPGDPSFESARRLGKPLFLLAWESSIINPDNVSPEQHEFFQHVFTHDDCLVDGKKYIKIAYSFVFPTKIPPKKEPLRFSCLIAGNKISDHPLELYSARKQVIDWFQSNHPEEFDLFGQGWDLVVPSKTLGEKIWNHLPSSIRHIFPRYKAYKGTVADKIDLYRNYRFSFCFENARGLPGYISEKIFHSIFAGCVPIYLGAPNIGEFIPKACYIDYRDFPTMQDLYSHLKNISESEYSLYQKAIQQFLEIEHSGLFSQDYFCRTILDCIDISLSGNATKRK